MPVREEFFVPGRIQVVETLHEIVRAIQSCFVIKSLPSDLVHFRAEEFNLGSDLFGSLTSMLDF
jgi:hypothetical protein